MDPITLSLLISAGPAIVQGIQGIRQTREGKEMQRNLGARVNYEIPEEAKKALALAQGLASSREMPGQSGMQAMMDLQSQRAFGNASRAAISSQDLLGVATNLGEQAQENQINLGIQSAQNYQQRQQALQQALGTMAGYQEKKTADRQQDWYERAQAAAAMRGAGMENTMGAIQGLAGAGMQGLAMGAEAGMFDAKKLVEGDASDLIRKSMMDQANFALTKRREIPSSAPATTNTSYGNYRDKLGLDGSYLYPDTPVQPPQPGIYNGIDMNNWRQESGLYDFAKPGKAKNVATSGQIPSSITDMLNMMMFQKGLNLY